MKNPTTSFLNAVFTGELGLAISRFSACSGKQLLNISGTGFYGPVALSSNQWCQSTHPSQEK